MASSTGAGNATRPPWCGHIAQNSWHTSCTADCSQKLQIMAPSTITAASRHHRKSQFPEFASSIIQSRTLQTLLLLNPHQYAEGLQCCISQCFFILTSQCSDTFATSTAKGVAMSQPLPICAIDLVHRQCCNRL